MEKAEGVEKKIKRRKRKSSNYAYVRKKKKKTGQVVAAQEAVEGERTSTQLENEMGALSTSSTAGAREDNSQVLVAVCEDSSSVSSEDLESLMMM